MYFCVICFRKPNHACVSAECKRNSTQHLITYGKHITFSGLFMSEDRVSEIGDLFILKAETRREVEAIIENHPHFQTGIVDHYEIHPWAQHHHI
jgi:uncharacterized protein YciI